MIHEDTEAKGGVARLAYEANAAICRAFGDDSQPAWADAAGWQRESVERGVDFHIANPDASPPASHEAWVYDKVANGWVYGETKDADLKTHPCIVEFARLPREQRVKDHVFRAVVRTCVELYNS